MTSARACQRTQPVRVAVLGLLTVQKGAKKGKSCRDCSGKAGKKIGELKTSGMQAEYLCFACTQNVGKSYGLPGHRLIVTGSISISKQGTHLTEVCGRSDSWHTTPQYAACRQLLVMAHGDVTETRSEHSSSAPVK